MVGPATSADQTGRRLRAAALLYAFGLTVHTLDHSRRGLDTVTPEISMLGTFGLMAGVAVIALVLRGHPRAPLLAILLGVPKALAVSAVHLLPHWSDRFSDAFPGTGAEAVSWAAALIEVGGLLALGIAGLLALRAGGGQPTGAAVSPS